MVIPTLKQKCHSDNILTTVCPGSCKVDNFYCHEKCVNTMTILFQWLPGKTVFILKRGPALGTSLSWLWHSGVGDNYRLVGALAAPSEVARLDAHRWLLLRVALRLYTRAPVRSCRCRTGRSPGTVSTPQGGAVVVPRGTWTRMAWDGVTARWMVICRLNGRKRACKLPAGRNDPPRTQKLQRQQAMHRAEGEGVQLPQRQRTAEVRTRTR